MPESDSTASYPSRLVANYALVLLWAVYVSNQWARYILNYLYAISSDSSKYSISQACNLSSSEYGLLTGYGFSATFVITGLFMGRAADRYQSGCAPPRSGNSCNESAPRSR